MCLGAGLTQNLLAMPLAMQAGRLDLTAADAFQLWEDQNEALVENLEVEHERARRIREEAGVLKSEGHSCQRCGSTSPAEMVPCPANLTRSCGGALRLTAWSTGLRALQTPHCPNCGTVTYAPMSGVLQQAQDLARWAVRWNVTLAPCACCSATIASDAITCPRCGTTSPRGGFLVQPRLQRCARCGAQIASDAGLCISCGTDAFRPAGIFTSGPKDISLLSCTACGRHISADALLCVHCGASWSLPQATQVTNSGSASASSSRGGVVDSSAHADGEVTYRHVTLSEAIDAAACAAATPIEGIGGASSSRQEWQEHDSQSDQEEDIRLPDMTEKQRHPLTILGTSCQEADKTPISSKAASDFLSIVSPLAPAG